MGNLNCKTCNCASLFEKKNELDLKNKTNSNELFGYAERSKSRLQTDIQQTVKKNNHEISYEMIKPFIPKIEAL